MSGLSLLENITRDEVLLLEMIRGVADPKLREEFLKQQNPTLDGLKAIAEQWHSATCVGKHLGVESDSVNVYKVSRPRSTYKSQKFDNWQGDQKNSKGYDCLRCGNPRCKSLDTCPAKDAKCYGCEGTGHYERVCSLNKGRPPENEKGHRIGVRDRSPTPGPYARSRCVKVTPRND